MDHRAAKLALARKKLKDHQDKKLVGVQNVNINNNKTDENIESEKISQPAQNVTVDSEYHSQLQDIDSDPNEVIENNKHPLLDINVTEILISNKMNLESQVKDLQMKLSQLETNHVMTVNDYKLSIEKIAYLEHELKNIKDKYQDATKEICIKDTKINELNDLKVTLTEENSNLTEQLEFTKTLLNAKEVENGSLHSQLYAVQNQYDALKLQLEQLTNGLPTSSPNDNSISAEENERLLHKVSTLEQQLSLMQKERDQINQHYEHYVAELNKQLKSVVQKNGDLATEVQCLSNRENSLIEQISDMEIRIQNYNSSFKKESEMQHNSSINLNELQENFRIVQDELSKLRIQHEELQKKYAERIVHIEELTKEKQPDCEHIDISLSKLNADITSDKVAAQRATEQNKKLKLDLQKLEDDFVKMSKDKLELTEKLTAEKYLNRELTLKLSEIDEKAKDLHSKLKAKDEEMIRLQTSYREIEKQFELLKENNFKNNCQQIEVAENTVENPKDLSCADLYDTRTEPEQSLRIQKEDAMHKLQERFLKIMGDVADLSDEKHRLEHIILQLQNETDTICEYVALYQQQRSLLKRRDEERSTQLKLFQQECGKLKSQLEELSILLVGFAEDKELALYFQNETRRHDIKKVMNLLSDLKNNSLIDPIKTNVDFKNFYPCNCCSGKLIDV